MPVQGSVDPHLPDPGRLGQQDRPGPGRPAGQSPGPRPVHALLQQRVAGDTALLRLAGLRFALQGFKSLPDLLSCSDVSRRA